MLIEHKVDKKLSFAIILGNTVAWADFALYAYFSLVLSKVFFPFTSSANAYILYFIVFALGFLFRPIGSAIAGVYADKHGRKNTLMATVIISSVITALIGLLPSYDTIGFFSPLLLTILRILQTMSISAEPTNSGSLLIESAPDNRKGLVTSCVMVGIFVGFVLGIYSFYLLSSWLTTEQMSLWGWRLSFLFFASLGIIVVIVLSFTEESPLFLQRKKENRLNPHPFKTAVAQYPRQMFIAFGYALMMAVTNYFLLGYVPKFAQHTLGLSQKQESLAITFCLVITVILIPFMGLLSDKVGRRWVMGGGALGFCLLGYPMILLINTGEYHFFVFALAIYGVLLAPVSAVLPVALAEMFPFEVRCTGGAIGYNIALLLLGGTTPIVVSQLVKVSGTFFAAFWYISGVAFIHLMFIIFSKETKNTDLSV
ncbi:MFS transporter [uncultured Shewanella sp.]|uniref:MFS transporter n=1 Tax=uncultured Shewanella sp. TaxID=173975 RepID=UPI0026332854|nr:MFS transporter [uncultured Shewanella sp.]